MISNQDIRGCNVDQAEFVEKFGSIFEHSPWVAQDAYDLMQKDNFSFEKAMKSINVHPAMVAAFQSASNNARMDVLLAHPDLAGKLAQAKQLTSASTNEQASVGLDALTDAEREMFMHQNDAYVAKFGFPFIIAVLDNTKATIVEAFEKRLKNTKTQEFEEACKQVERIAYHRLNDMLD